MAANDISAGHVTGGWAAIIVRLRWLWVALALAMLVLGAMGASKLQLNPDARQFFAEENPDRIALDEFEIEFAKDDNLLITISPKSGDAFAPEVLRMTGELTERAWLLPFVRRVNSLTNFQHTYAEGDEMIVRDLVPDIEAVDAAAGNEAREIALSRPEIVHSLISPDGKHAALQVLFRLPGTDVFTEVPSVVAETEVLMEEIRAANPDIRFGVTGSVMIRSG